MTSKSQSKRMAIQRGEDTCILCGKHFSGSPHVVHLYSGIFDEGPYCEECANNLQSSEDAIIGLR